MTTYRLLSLILGAAFAVTGTLFLLFPDAPIAFFNSLSSSFGMPQSPVNGWDFYVILAVGYMYVVTILAFSMCRHPENRELPRLLVHAKLASSALSLGLFLLQAHYLIYMVNGIVDGLIGITVLIMYRRMGTR